MTANGVSEVDEKRVDASVGQVSHDDSLMLFQREVNAELFSMTEKGQSAVDAGLISVRTPEGSKETLAHNVMLRSSKEPLGICALG